MSLEDDPPPGKIPTIVWAALAAVVIFLFVVLLRVMNPPGVGQGPTASPLPLNPQPASITAASPPSPP